jgi:hypothetical protein
MRCKKLKRKRKNDEEQLPLSQKTRDSTICLSIAGKLKQEFKPLLSVIQKTSASYSKLAYHASLLANLFLARSIQENVTMIIPDLDRDFFYTCLRFCASNSKMIPELVTQKNIISTEKQLRRQRETLFPKGKGLVQVAYGDNVLAYLATAMATTMSNYDSIAIFDHLVHYIRAKYKLELKGHAKFIVGRITAKNPLDFEETPKNIGFDRKQICDLITQEHNEFNEAFSEDTTTSEKRVVYRWNMIKTIEESTNDEKRYKSFALIPLRNMGVKFVDMDLRVMKSLFQSTKPQGFPRPYQGKYKAPLSDEHQYWLNLSDEVQKFTHPSQFFKSVPEKKGWVLQPTFRTDGYEIHWLFDKNQPRTKNNKKMKVKRKAQSWPQDFDPSYDPIRTKDCLPGDYAAADVGHHYIVYAASPTGETRPDGKPDFEKRCFSKKEYNHKSKRNKKNRKMGRLRKSKDIQKIQNQLSLNTIKTANPEKLVAAIFLCMQHYDSITNHYNNHQLRKLKFEARIAEQRTIDQLVHYVTWEGRKVLGLGDCSKTTGFKSLSPGGPTKKIKRHAVKKGYNVCSVDEFRTSMVPACCHHGEMQCIKDCRKENSKVHGLRTCPTCHSTWNRDFSAAINIWYLFYCVAVRSQPVPDIFNRKIKVSACAFKPGIFALN